MGDDIYSKEQEILDSLRIKFVESSQAKLMEISAEIDNIRSTSHPGDIEPVLNEIHTLKGLGGTFGFRDFSLIAARFEDYLQGLTEMSEQHIDDFKVFIRRLRDCIEREAYPSPAELEKILSDLPTL